MSGEERKPWLQTVPGVLTALAALVTAATGLIAAFTNFFPKSASPVAQDCVPGYVYREAYPDDHVCVTPETRARTLQDNQLAGSRRRPGGGPFGADTCEDGFVWRDAFPGDHVCVTPETREQAATDNRDAPLRVRR